MCGCYGATPRLIKCVTLAQHVSRDLSSVSQSETRKGKLDILGFGDAECCVLIEKAADYLAVYFQAESCI